MDFLIQMGVFVLLMRLTNDKALAIEGVLWDLEVKRSRTLSNSTRNVVVRTVARAEPTTKVTGLTDRDTTQVSADTKHNKPSRVLNTLFVGLGITEDRNVNVTGLSNLVSSTVTNENGLTTPLDDDVTALGDGGEVDLDLGQSQNISRSAHGRKEVLDGGLGSGSRDHTKGTNHEVRESTVGITVSVLLEVGCEVRDLVCRATDGSRRVETVLGKSYKKCCVSGCSLII